MNLDLDLESNMEKNLVCKKCNNTTLLGIKYLNEYDQISQNIKLYTFCIFNHTHKNELFELSIKDIFSDEGKKNFSKILEIKCEYCKKYSINNLCLDCKRNLCKECIKFHKFHKIYDNNQYLFTQNDLNNIENDFNKSKNILNENLLLLQSKIDNFKSQLSNLENLFEEYKNINNKLILLSKFIINKYKNDLNLNKPIYYPISFNLKNILKFNFQKLILENNDISINAFTNIILDKIKSGFYFLVLQSNLSENLKDYTNSNMNSFNSIIFDEFKEIETEYSTLIFLREKNKIIGLKNKKTLDIYNIQNNTIESSIRFEDYINDIFIKFNFILVLAFDGIYILNSKNLSILQKIKIEDISKEKNENKNIKYSFWDSNIYNQRNNDQINADFIHVEILGDNLLGIIYKGDLRYLEKKNILNEVIKFPISNESYLKVINYKNSNFESLEDSEKFIYLLIYSKENIGYYKIKKIILLIKESIGLDEVSIICGKYFQNEDTECFCNFIFKSLIQFSEKELIISFKSCIESDREQYYYYVNDKNYSDETIYYYLNIEKDNMIETKICSSEEDTFIYKDNNEKKIYFIYNKPNDCTKKLKKILKDYEFVEIKIKDYNFIDFYYQNKTLIGWNNKVIYLGKINYKNEFEVIKTYNKLQEKINFVNLNPNLIFYTTKNKDNEKMEEE